MIRPTAFQRIRRLGQTLKHAFAVDPDAGPLSREDELLLDRMATAVVDRGMARPTVLFLDSFGPMNFLGSQALHFLTPIVGLACSTRDLEHAARILDRRDALPRLVSLIEEKAERRKTSSR